MASKKITAMPDWAGNQVSTDLITGVDLSASLANQNVKSTLNDLFSVITKNITDGAIRFQEFTAPALSGAGEGALYFDDTDKTFKGSRNGSAFDDLLFGAGANQQVAVFTSSIDKVAGYAPFYYNNLLERLYITDTVFSPTIEVSKTGTSPAYAKIFGGQGFASLGNWSVTAAAPAYLNFYRGANGPALPTNGMDIGSIRFRPAVDASDTPTTVGGARIDVRATENAVVGVGGGVGLTIFTAANGEVSDNPRLLINYLGAVMVGVNSATITTNTGAGTRTVLGQLTTYDADAIHQIGNPTATNRKTLVIQAIAGQTKTLTEWQTSAGAFLFSIGAGGSLSFGGTTGIAVSAAGQGRIYYDSGLNKFQASENGGAYVDLISGGSGTLTVNSTPIASGTAGRLLYETTGNVLGETAGYDYSTSADWTLSGTPAATKSALLLYEPGSTAPTPGLTSTLPVLLHLHNTSDINYAHIEYSTAADSMRWITGINNLGYLYFEGDIAAGTQTFNFAMVPVASTVSSHLFYPSAYQFFSVSATYFGGIAEVSSDVFGLMLTTSTPTSGSQFPLTWSNTIVQVNKTFTVAPQVRTSGSLPYAIIQTPADTTLTASTESVGIYFGGAGSGSTVTRQWSTGALTTQREYVFVAPTYAFAGASTLTTASTVVITAAPVAGTNATITTSNALLIESGSIRGPNGTSTNPTYGWSSNTSTGFNYNPNSKQGIDVYTHGVNQISLGLFGSGTVIKSGTYYGFASGDPTNSSPDTGITRLAASVLRISNASTGAGKLVIGSSSASSTAADLYVVGSSASLVPLRVDSAASPTQPIFEVRVNGAADSALEVDGDSTAGNTRLLIYDVDNATLERVTVGAADSGGTGFKVLRIPN